MNEETLGTLLKRMGVSALGVLLGSALAPGIEYEGAGSLVLVVLLLGIFSAVLKPLLVFFALPFVLVTFGFGLLFINALLYLLAGNLVDGFEVAGFWSAFFGALIISLLNALLAGFIYGGGPGAGGGGGPSGRVRVRRRRSARPKDDVIDI